MTSVLVTGAGGFTASHLIPRLLAENYTVHAMAYQRSREISGTVASRWDVDLLDRDALLRAVQAIKPDYVVHLAGIAFVAHGNSGDLYRTNLIGSDNLLWALAELPSPPTAILLASSANVYGNRREGILAETVPPEPVSPYAVSKLAMEFAARTYSNHLPIIIVRPFNYTGVGQSVDFVIPKLVDHIQRKAYNIALGNLDVERDFSDVRGVVDAYARLLRCSEAIGETLNICSGRGYSLRDLLDLARRISGKALEVTVDPALVRENEVHSLYGDNSRLQARIGKLCMPPLSETLRWMLDA